LQFLQQHLPGVIPADMTGYGFYCQSRAALDIACQYDIDNWGDKMALVATTLMNPDLLQAPELDTLLSAHGWQQGELGTYLAAQTGLFY
jgi:hypothetical protein